MKLGRTNSIEPNWLTTHSLTIGMTGSGKTGLGICMLEEAFKLRIPAIIIDVKGDLSTLASLNSEKYFVEVYIPEGSGEIPPNTNEFFYKNKTPGATIIYLAHCSLRERDSIISQILGDFNIWMRGRGGSSNLRGIVYIDEIHGLIPPIKKSETKEPLMNLLKISRSFGYGICLATQNPGDLDYKALSNIGTWFVGKLTTKRDRSKVLEGLEGSVKDCEMLKLKKREFIQRSVYSDTKKFKTRDITVTLNGPLSLIDALNFVNRFSSKYRCDDISESSRVAETYESFLNYCKDILAESKKKRVIDLKESVKKDYNKLFAKKKKFAESLIAEEARLRERGIGSMASIASTIVSALTSKSFLSISNISKVGTAAKNHSRTESTKQKVARIKSELSDVTESIKLLKVRLDKEYVEIISKEVIIEKVELWSDLLDCTNSCAD